MNLKQQLRLYIKKRGFTAAQLSRLSGVPKQSISDWLAGANPRNIDQVKKVADALCVSLEHLCFGTDDSVTADSMAESKSEWTEGIFEIKFRRIK